MNQDDEIERQLRPAFDALRQADAATTPSFDVLLARARAGVAAPAPVDESARRTVRRPWQWLVYAAPVAAAAGLALWFGPERAADREFERAVTDWTRSERALPTDGLLSVPGSEFLQRLPVLSFQTGRQRGPS